VPAREVGVILPHEHVFTDLRGPLTPGYGQADPADVVRVMKPQLAAARAAGVDLIIECTGIGVGRNVAVVAQLARETGVRIVVPTGVYGRAEFAPQAYRDMSERDLVRWMTREIRRGIDGADGIKAGFIKIATGAADLTPLEVKLLRAAGRAAHETGVAIASHTTSGTAAVTQVNILDQMGLAPRFVWVHAQAESDLHYHRQLAARGVYIELDSIGGNPKEDERWIGMIQELTAAGYQDRILLSHDAGWYNPGVVNGGTQRPYTYLTRTFIPKLRASGLSDVTIRALTSENPKRAFGVIRGSD
jgi:phosphotriesterase-related protein